MEPWRQLLRGSVPASDSILLAPHSNPFTGFFYSLRNRHYFNAYISFVAVLCEPLIIALSNIPFKPALTFIAYKASTYITIGVLSLMLIGIVWKFCRKGTSGLIANRPANIAELMIVLCGSHMLGDFADMSRFTRRERDAIITGWGTEYSMGSLAGVDGVERVGVDENKYIGRSRQSSTSEVEGKT